MAMKVRIAGDIAVVESALKFADLKTLSAGGNVVSVKDEDKKQVYAVCVAKSGKGGATETGATFKYANAEGFACFNLGPEDVAEGGDGKLSPEQVYKKIGAGIAAYNKYEDKVLAAMREAAEAKAAVMANITVG